MSYLINNTFGKDNVEKATIAFVVANATAGKGDARVFLSSEAIYLATPGGTDGLQADGYKPVGEVMGAFMSQGGKVWVCKACTDAKGITQDHLIEGAEIAGAGHTTGFLENGGQVIM
jgi:predicted peroxiredoxin